MARVHLGTDVGGATILYNIDQAVGRGAPNQRDDVILVQFILRKMKQNGGLGNGRGIKEPKDMRVDGIYGPITQEWIDFMPQVEPDLVGPGDGRVDPMRPGALTKSGRMSLLFFMNGRLALYPFRLNLGNDPECPADLRARISLGSVGAAGRR